MPGQDMEDSTSTNPRYTTSYLHIYNIPSSLSLEQHLTDAIRIEIKPNDDDIKTYLEQQLTDWESLK
jgi:hypothetical protein